MTGGFPTDRFRSGACRLGPREPEGGPGSGLGPGPAWDPGTLAPEASRASRTTGPNHVTSLPTSTELQGTAARWMVEHTPEILTRYLTACVAVRKRGQRSVPVIQLNRGDASFPPVRKARLRGLGQLARATRRARAPERGLACEGPTVLIYGTVWNCTSKPTCHKTPSSRTSVHA